jgi:predicted DNA-binding transcriptional regulator AlpA
MEAEMTRLLTEKDIVARTNVPAKTWQHHRLNGTGPEYIKIGRLVRYPEDEFEAWLESRRQKHTPRQLPRENV